MKIAIPVNDKSIGAGVCQSFGRTPYFLIHDIETKENTFSENSAAKSRGGAGIKAAQTIVDNKVGALIVPRCGENAAQVLNASDIKLFKTINGSVEDNIKAYVDGELRLLEEIHEGFHNEGK